MHRLATTATAVPVTVPMTVSMTVAVIVSMTVPMRVHCLRVHRLSARLLVSNRRECRYALELTGEFHGAWTVPNSLLGLTTRHHTPSARADGCRQHLTAGSRENDRKRSCEKAGSQSDLVVLRVIATWLLI